MAKSPVFHRGGSHAVLPLRTVNFLTDMTGSQSVVPPGQQTLDCGEHLDVRPYISVDGVKPALNQQEVEFRVKVKRPLL